MSIELLVVAAVVVAGVAIWYFNKGAGKADLNNDGKVDVKDAVVAVENTVKGTAAVAKSAAKTAKKSAAKATAKATGEKPARKPRTPKQKA